MTPTLACGYGNIFLLPVLAALTTAVGLPAFVWLLWRILK